MNIWANVLRTLSLSTNIAHVTHKLQRSKCDRISSVALYMYQYAKELSTTGKWSSFMAMAVLRTWYILIVVSLFTFDNPFYQTLKGSLTGLLK
jgi:hypothetical protein